MPLQIPRDNNENLRFDYREHRNHLEISLSDDMLNALLPQQWLQAFREFISSLFEDPEFGPAKRRIQKISQCLREPLIEFEVDDGHRVLRLFYRPEDKDAQAIAYKFAEQFLPE